MKKVKILLAALGVALMAMFALAPAAQAQTLASVTADPLFVAAGGADACDISNLTIVNADADGNFSAEWTYNIPAGGMCIGGGTLDQSYVGTFCVGVGAPVLPNSGSESTMIAVIGAAVLAGGAMIVLSTRRRSFVS